MRLRLRLLTLLVSVLASACGRSGGGPRDAGGDGPARDRAGDSAAADDSTGGGLDATDVATTETTIDALDEAPGLDAGPEDAPPDAVMPPPDVSADVGADITDARSFGDSGLTCGMTVLSYDWRMLPVGQWYVAHGAPMIDAAANELLLPRDGIVGKYGLSASKYFLEFDLSIDGDMTFYVSPSATFANEPLPSITRSGADLVLETYTVGDTAAKPGGGFQGQHISAQRIHVVLFLDTSPELLGMKVIAGGQTFWSGFTVLSRPPQDLQLVGASLPANATGTALVHVGPVSGCEVRFQNPCTMWLKPGFCPVDGASAPPF